MDALTGLAAAQVGQPHCVHPAVARAAAATVPPLTVWALLLACACLILLGAAAIARRQVGDDTDRRRPARRTTAHRAELQAKVGELANEVARLTATARHAAAAAARARAQSEVAQRALQVAENAYDAALREHAAARAAADDAAEKAVASIGSDTERAVSRAAFAAYRRGDISVEDLRRVWLGVSGWDARRQQAEAEVLRLRAGEARARHAYDMSMAAARLARQAEQVADVAAQALHDEVTAAADELAGLRPALRDRRRRRRYRQ